MISYERYDYHLKQEYIGIINRKEELHLILKLQRIFFYVDGIRKDMHTIAPYMLFSTLLLYFVSGIIRLYVLYV